MVEFINQHNNITPREFLVGQAVNRAFGIFFRHFIPFTLVLLILHIPSYFWQVKLAELGRAVSSGYPTAEIQQQMLIWTFGGVGILLLLQSFGAAVMLFATFQVMRGRPLNMAESIGRGVARLLPVLIASILVGLGAGFAAILLLVPGLILYMRWYLTIPVCVVEGLGPLTAMKRSVELTQGNRWKLFGFFIVLLVISWLISKIIAAVFGQTGSLELMVLISTIAQAIIAAFSSVASAVIYHDIRVAKEGIDIEAIASVFD